MVIKEFHLKIGDALKVDSSAGNLLKWKQINSGEELFIKTSSYNSYNDIWLYESYSEVIVCRLLKYLGIQNILMYYPCRIYLDNGDITIGCYSTSFLKNDEKFISLANLQKAGKLDNYAFCEYDGYKKFIADIDNLLGINYKPEINKILAMDYITMNEDRHFGNIGFVYNILTGKMRKSPIFDNGNSLFSLKNIDELNYSHELDTYVKSKPFNYNHHNQLYYTGKLYMNLNVQEAKSKTWYYIDKLKTIGLEEHRAEFIKQLISIRIIDVVRRLA